MDALKELFNKNYYKHLAGLFEAVDNGFKADKFLEQVTKDLDQLSLNQRLRNTSVVLKDYLPADFKRAIEIMYKVIPHARGGYANLVFPDFVGLYGHAHFKLAMQALKHFTVFGSSEFAIREFLKRDFDKTYAVMCDWAKDKDPHVRRLASEGSRPRLPWSFKLDEVVNDPTKTKTILELLKEDEELYVKKSVANHLNDISKQHPDYMVTLVNSWDKKNPNTAWIIKHASRTLIKKGHSDSLAIFGFEKNPKIKLDNFKIQKNRITLGDELHFEFDLRSDKKTDQKLVVDYIIHYRKKSGELSPKVFKLKELNLKPGEKIKISKKQMIKDFSTRKHFAGEHVVEIQINGKVLTKESFKLSL